MKKKENKLQELYKGNMLGELPLSLSLLTPPIKNVNDDKRKARFASSTFYRAMYYQCNPPIKQISRMIDPKQT